MASQSIKFHEVCGTAIRLSDDRMQAGNTGGGGSRLCFTSRPLAPGEKLIVSGDELWGIRAGVIENDPSKVRESLPGKLCFYHAETGIRGGENLVAADLETDNALDRNVVIYFEASRGEVIGENNIESKVLVRGITTTEPVYIIFELYWASLRIVRTILAPRLRPVITTTGQLDHLEGRISKNQRVTPASFSCSGSSGVTVRPHFAVNHNPSVSEENFVFVETPLEPDSFLIVELVELKNDAPLEIVLTTEAAQAVSSCGRLSKLCETTSSRMMKCEGSKVGDVLAVGIARDGSVKCRLNEGVPVEQMRVDANLEYHVVFSMANIAILSMVGILTSGPHSPKETTLVCLENTRAVAMIPCYHFAVCPTCSRFLKSEKAKRCPTCRRQRGVSTS